MTTDQGGIPGGTPGQDRSGSIRPEAQQDIPGRAAEETGDTGGAQGGGGAGAPGWSNTIGAGEQLGRAEGTDIDATDEGDLISELPDVFSEEDLTGDVGDDDEASGPMGGTIGS